MAASVSTPAIRAAYASLLDPDGDVNWLIVGQTPPNNRLELVDQGAEGLTELRRKLLAGRSLHGLLNVEGRVLFWSQIPDELTGVKRARALVQARHVASLLPRHDAIVTFAAPIDLEPALVAIKLFHQHPQNSPTIRVESPHTFEGRRPSVPESLHALAPRPSLEAEKQHPYMSHRAAGPPAHLPSAQSHEEENPARRSSGPSAVRLDKHLPDVQNGEAGYLSASAAPPSTMSSHLSPNSIPLHGLAISAIPSPPVSPAYPPPRPEAETAQPSTSSPPGVLDSAAAAMLVSSPSDSSIALSLQEVPIDIGEDELTSRRSTMQVFAAQAVSTRGLGISGQPDGFRASVYPSDSPLTAEPDEVHNRDSVLAPPIPPLAEDNDFTPPTTVESDLDTTSSAKDVEGPSDSATVDAKEAGLRQRGAEEAAAAERKHAAEQAEDDQRQRLEEEEERVRLAAEAEGRQRIAEEARIREEAEEAERVRRAEEEAAAAAAEAARIEDERREAERLRLAQEEEQRRAEARRRELEERKTRLLAARDAGEVMLRGSVNVQANDSVLWKRRFFDLKKTQLNLYKSEIEPDDILITIPVEDISRLTTNPEEALVPHSFKLRLRDGGGLLFYYNTAEETERLVEALRCAIERQNTLPDPVSIPHIVVL